MDTKDTNIELRNRIDLLELKIDKIILLLYNNNLIGNNLHNNNQNQNITKEKKEPSSYNKFMKKEFERLKIENPELSHKERFKIAALLWKDSNENPKNKK
jgi:hypothetical protein